MFEVKRKTVNKVVLIPADKIQPNPAQPRRQFSEEELEGLSQSIKENGILQPVSVRKNIQGGYELIAGERRLRAAKMAGLSEIPCIICEATPKESAVYAVLENLQRANLSPIEEANALKQLIVEWNVTQEDAAARLGMAQSTFANKLRLLKLYPKTQELISESGLAERQARALLKIKDEKTQVSVAKTIIEKGLNVAETEKFIESKISAQIKKPKNRKIVVKDVRLFINTINKAINTMKQAGIPAMAQKYENGEYIEYTVRIPMA